MLGLPEGLGDGVCDEGSSVADLVRRVGWVDATVRDMTRFKVSVDI